MTRKELGVILSRKLVTEPIKGCWFIQGNDWSNYTHINKEQGHRLVYRLCIGPLISGKLICHHCDRPGCLNPKHLYQGTAKTNFNDAIRRGRFIRSKINYRKDVLELDRLAALDREKNLRTPWEVLEINRANRSSKR